jgi:hypothetical protein
MFTLNALTHRTFRVPTSDPFCYPYAILSKRRNSPEGDGFELHFVDAGAKTDWVAHAESLRDTGEFEWVALTTANFWDDESDSPMGGGPPPRSSRERPQRWHRYSRRS